VTLTESDLELLRRAAKIAAVVAEDLSLAQSYVVKRLLHVLEHLGLV